MKFIIEQLNKNHNIGHQIYLVLHTLVNVYPPRKNENKFIYGKVGELAIIDNINKLPDIECECLDDKYPVGSSYRVDCRMSYNNISDEDYSIKITKQGGLITIINKRNKSDHTIDGLKFIIAHIKKRKLYIFKYDEELKDFIKNDGAGVHFKSGIFNYLDKNRVNSIYNFPNDEKNSLIEKKLENLKEDNIYEKIYKQVQNTIEYNRNSLE